MNEKSAPAILLVIALAFGGCGGAGAPETGSSQEALTAVTSAMGSVGSVAEASSEVAEQNAAAAPSDAGSPGGGDGAGPSCMEVLWTIFDPLHVSVRWNGCILASGQGIDGTIDGWLNYQGVQGAVGIGFNGLTVGTQSLSGLMVGTAIEPHGNRYDLDVTFADAATGLAFEIDQGVLETAPGVTTLEGSGSIANGSDDFDVTILDTLRWDDPSTCYPTSGRLSLSTQGQPGIEATFVGTPAGPAVDVQLAPAPAAPVRMALPPCAGE